MAIIPWKPKEVWWDPFSDLNRIQREMNRLFDSSLTGRGPKEDGLLESAWVPAMDVYESKDNVLVKADIPGLKKEEIEVSVHGDTLTIKGEKSRENETKAEDFVRTERYYGSFNRSVRLPSEVEAEKVEAKYSNGVLELVLPKKEQAKPKQLKIDIK